MESINYNVCFEDVTRFSDEKVFMLDKEKSHVLSSELVRRCSLSVKKNPRVPVLYYVCVAVDRELQLKTFEIQLE